MHVSALHAKVSTGLTQQPAKVIVMLERLSGRSSSDVALLVHGVGGGTAGDEAAASSVGLASPSRLDHTASDATDTSAAAALSTQHKVG